MASNTSNLGLLKKDPLTDGKDTFNIRTMLNENWDKIDEFAGKTTPISKGGTGATTAAQALANLGGIAAGAVGNLHVWKRVQTYADPVPEVPPGYNIGTDTFPSVGNCWFRLISASVGSDMNTLHAGDVVANKDGTLVFTTSQRIGVYNSKVYGFGASGTSSGNMMTADNITTEYQGKFVKTKSGTTVQFASGLEENVVYYVPTDATVSIVVEGNNAKIVFSDLRVVTGYPYTPAIPAGTTTDYLTSTDRNAYPDKSAEGGEPEIPAHYTLADAVTVDVLSSAADYSAMVYVCDLNSIIINNDGSISTTSFSTLMGGSNALTMVGNWTKFSTTKAYYITSNSSNVVFTDTIFTVSAETTLQYADGKYVLPGCRELIGHAKVEAIPSNTSITYLGQLGGGARIEVGSYVGTGTYGSSNPNTLTFGFEPKLVLIFTSDNNRFSPYGFVRGQGSFIVIIRSQSSDVGTLNNITWNSTIVSWYAYSLKGDGQLLDYGVAGQLNASQTYYYYVAIG